MRIIGKPVKLAKLGKMGKLHRLVKLGKLAKMGGVRGIANIGRSDPLFRGVSASLGKIGNFGDLTSPASYVIIGV